LVLQKRPKRLYLDFDGVIMDSMEAKLDAYMAALRPYSPVRESVRVVQRRSAGLSRSKTIPIMMEECCRLACDALMLQDALERFRQSDEKSRETLQLMPGALSFLDAVFNAGQDLWILTGTPQEVIQVTLNHFDLRRFFTGVLGSPPGKAEHFQKELRATGFHPQECLFIGDSPQDLAAAKAVGIPFIGLAQTSQDRKAMDLGYAFDFIQTLADLLPWPVK
jgi:HAD superfamily hydrolase (TIGR01509 family)